MIKRNLKKKLKDLYSTIRDQKHCLPVLILTSSFIFLNALKLTIFRDSIIWNFQNVYFYIFITSFLWSIVLYVFLLSRKHRAWFFIIYLLQMIYLIINITYAHHFGQYLSLTDAWNLLGQGMILVKHKAFIPGNEAYVLFIDIIPFIGLVIFFKPLRRFFKKTDLSFFKACLAGLLLLVSVFFGVSCTKNFKQNLKYYGDVVFIKRFGLFPLQIKYLFTAKNYSLHYGRQVKQKSRAKKNYNVIFIQVEALDAGAVQCRHKGKYIMPYLQSLSTNSVHYPYMMSYHKGGGTSDSEFSIINSVEPLDTKPAITWDNYDYTNSFVRVLTNKGYHTLAAHGNTKKFWNRGTAFARMGYRVFHDSSSMKLAKKGWGNPDHLVFPYVAEKLSKQNQPYFCHIITMSTHEPYGTVKFYYTNQAYADVQDGIRKWYYNSMSYVDEAIREFIQSLGSLENTYVFIYGDHSTIKINNYKRAVFYKEGRKFEFVPLFILTPDHLKYRETQRAASMLDISPTVLNLTAGENHRRSDANDLLAFPVPDADIPLSGLALSRKKLYEQADRIFD